MRPNCSHIRVPFSIPPLYIIFGSIVLIYPNRIRDPCVPSLLRSWGILRFFDVRVRCFSFLVVCHGISCDALPFPEFCPENANNTNLPTTFLLLPGKSHWFDTSGWIFPQCLRRVDKSLCLCALRHPSSNRRSLNSCHPCPERTCRKLCNSSCELRWNLEHNTKILLPTNIMWNETSVNDERGSTF